MTTKELIKAEIDVFDDQYLDELYQIIKQYTIKAPLFVTTDVVLLEIGNALARNFRQNAWQRTRDGRRDQILPGD